jgi:thiol-disulfide isomerase/thioredoxin
MKKTILTYTFIVVPMIIWCQNAEKNNLRNLLSRLEKIKGASYIYCQTASLPFDTIPSLSYSVLKKEFIAPGDEYVGASIASFNLNDTSRLEFFYDGKSKAYLDWENKIIPIDSFKFNPHPFRIVYPPFITYVKSLLKYALETHDTISLSTFELPDTIIIKLYIKNKAVEVVGNRIVYAELPDMAPDELFTEYEIWFDGKNKLPAKIIKRLPNRICWETCRNIRINETNPESFDPGKYFPPDFIIFSDVQKENEIDLTGNAAPDWILEDINDNRISLKDVKAKIIIIQFTGLGCGPCQSAIPYLKKISNEYQNNILEVVAIETWSNNKTALTRYLLNKGINYRYLIANEKVIRDYQVNGVPKFIIIDTRGLIRKIITGFNGANTINEINGTIGHLMSE